MTTRSAREWSRIEVNQRKILETHLSNFPVQLGALARDLGVSVKVSTMKPGVSGQISHEGNGYVIRVNRNEMRERQRFTIAHELSHYLLHRSIIDASPEGIVDNVLYRSGKAENIEFEANRLAAEIVMPAANVNHRLRELGGVVTEYVIELLATEFKVSKSAMEIRLGASVAA